MWTPTQVVAFAKDCIANGVEAISLGGGEPLEYVGVFNIIDELMPLAYVSITTNGLPLEQSEIWGKLIKHSPDKLHITIHNPDNQEEVCRVIAQIRLLSETHIKPGVNLLVSNDKIEDCRAAYRQLRTLLHPSQIILVPRRYSHTPTPKQLASVTDGEPFQSPSCLIGCIPPTDFASVSWDKKVNHCSYALGKQPLQSLTFQGLTDALNSIRFTSCQKSNYRNEP